MSAEVLPIKNDREAWLEWRRGGIGGSDAAAIFGLDPFRSPMTVWLDKSGYLPDTEESEAMRWGSLLEGIVADEFERRTGFEVRERQLCLVHPEYPWMRATLDGRVTESGVLLGNYEGKCSAWRAKWTDGVPDHVQVQCQHGMAVTGARRTWVVLLLNGNELKWWEVERDEAVIEVLIVAERDFWRRVEEGIPPPVDGSEVTTESIKAAFSEAIPNSHVDLPSHAAELIAEYHLAADASKAADARKQEAANAITALLGEAQVGLLAGEKAVSWPLISAKDFDLKGLEARHPKVYQRFASTRTYRRLTVHQAPKGGEET